MIELNNCGELRFHDPTDQNILLRLIFYAIQFLWIMIAIDPRTRNYLLFIDLIYVGDIMGQNIWIVSSLSIFLQSDFISSSKRHGHDNFILSSALVGAVLRLYASVIELKIKNNLLEDKDQVVSIIERMLFSCKPDLLISCGESPQLDTAEIDGILLFVVQTKDIWSRGEESGAVFVYVVNAIYTILLVMSLKLALICRKILLVWGNY